MRDVYSKYWITARERIYGFSDYDKNLCHYISEHLPPGSRLLEVALGTGYPFADFFQKTGFRVYGLDISPDLITKCRRLNPNIECQIGDAENLDYPDDFFDGTYCFHSTWYFPNLNRAIDEMMRVTRPGGLVLFDIQNRNHEMIERDYRRLQFIKTGRGRAFSFAKNIAKVILRRGIANWHCIVYEVPTNPKNIYEHFEERQIRNFQVMVRTANGSIEARNEIGPFRDFPRLVFVVRK